MKCQRPADPQVDPHGDVQGDSLPPTERLEPVKLRVDPLAAGIRVADALGRPEVAEVHDRAPWPPRRRLRCTMPSTVLTPVRIAMALTTIWPVRTFASKSVGRPANVNV